MFDALFTQLSDRYHVIAPDYLGFGHSDWPDPKKFAYTFDHIAEIMNHFTEALGLSRYTPYRLAPEHPFPAAVQDVEGCYRGLVDKGFNTIAVSGDSAGGNLAYNLARWLMSKIFEFTIMATAWQIQK